MARDMNRGFSLVELSIVLVILGLLTGGILAGQSLIRAAELRAAGTEYSRWATAMQTFRDKYFAIPGDFNKATDFWGAADTTPTTCLTTAGTGSQTCNGDGDGILDFPAAGGNQRTEHFMYWQHLANAGLIEGSYTGMAGAVYEQDCRDTNSPRSKVSSGQWFISNDSTSGGAFFPAAVARHNYRLGGGNPGSWPALRLLAPEELWNIDTKIDDGKPALGKVTAPHNGFASLPDCATAATSTAEYELTISGKECIAIIDAGF